MAGTTRVDLLTNAVAGNGADLYVQAGQYNFYAEATFGGGSVKLQFLSPQQTWIDMPSGSFSANNIALFQLHAGRYRAVAAGGGLSAAYAALFTVPTITTH